MDIATKCSIIAGMNQKDTTKSIDSNNLDIEQSLLSRFDLIFALEDQHDEELDLILCNHILNFDDDNVNSSWSLERLRMHVAVAKDLKVEVSAQAFEVLKAYFLYCKNDDDEIEISRRTMRLFDALKRLTISHAKLMLRSKAEVIDAVAVVMIMESSWSFGRLSKHRHDVMRSHVPLGPPPEYCAEVLERLNLEFLVERSVEMEAEEMDIDPMFQDVDADMSSRTFEELEPPKANKPKRKDEQVEEENEKKKQKIDKKSENDSVLMKNLKSLAAKLADERNDEPKEEKVETEEIKKTEKKFVPTNLDDFDYENYDWFGDSD